MRIKIVFTKEDYEKLKQYKETGHGVGCSIMSCDGIECEFCPLNSLLIDERLEYIKNHLEEEKMGDLLFSQRLYLENEYYKWKEELDDKAGCVTLDCPMLMVSFLQDRGYINVNKVIEDWRLKENEN